MSELDDTEASILRAVAAAGGEAATSRISDETGITHNATLSRGYDTLADDGLVTTRKEERDATPFGERVVTLTEAGEARADDLGDDADDADDAPTESVVAEVERLEGRLDRLRERVDAVTGDDDRDLAAEVDDLAARLDRLEARVPEGGVGDAARTDAREAADTAVDAADRASTAADRASTQADWAERRADAVADRVDDELRAMRDVRGAVAAAGLLDSSRDAEGRDRYGASDMARRLAALDDAGVVEALAEAAPTEVEAAGEVAGETVAAADAGEGVRLDPEVAETVTMLYETGVFGAVVESVMGAEVPDDAVEGEPAADGGSA